MVYPILSTVVLALIALGLWKRRVAKVHITLMLLAFAIDVGMVLALELQRFAVEQVIEGVKGLLAFHVVISIGVVLLYALLISSGYKLWKGEMHLRNRHRWLAAIFIVGRLINYITSFYVGSS